MTAKQQSIKLLSKLEQVILGFTNQAFLSNHKSWLSNEIALFAERNGLPQAIPPGEGVRLAEPPRNVNQLPSERNFLQWGNREEDTKEEGITNMGPKGKYLGKTKDKWPKVTTVSWSDGSLSVYNHNGGGGEGKAIEEDPVSAPMGEEKVAPGAKEGPMPGLRIVNPMGGPKVPGVGEADGTGPEEKEDGLLAGREAGALPEPAQEADKPTWPKEARVSILGPTINQKLCLGALVDEGDRLGRKVSVWKGRWVYRRGSILKCRLDLVQGDDARYLPL